MNNPKNTPNKQPTNNENENKNKITDKNGVIRFDFQFSYWIFIWFVFYYLIAFQKEPRSPLTKIIFNRCNPIFSLFFALLENIFTFFTLLFYNPKFSIVVKYIVMILSIKIIPIYLLLRLTKYHNINWKSSIISFGILFGIYNLYLFENNTNIIEIYTKTVYYIFTDQNKTFMFSIFDKIHRFFTMKI